MHHLNVVHNIVCDVQAMHWPCFPECASASLECCAQYLEYLHRIIYSEATPQCIFKKSVPLECICNVTAKKLATSPDRSPTVFSDHRTCADGRHHGRAAAVIRDI
jgi:hypothetical protein